MIMDWKIILGSSLLTALLVSIITFFKDLFFEKRKNKSLQDQIKFERAHLKQIEIIEKLNLDIAHLLNKVIEFSTERNYSLSERNDLSATRNIRIRHIHLSIENLNGYINFAKLYLSSEYLEKIQCLIESFYLSTCHTYENFDHVNSGILEEKGIFFEESYDQSINEITMLSKQIINKKDF